MKAIYEDHCDAGVIPPVATRPSAVPAVDVDDVAAWISLVVAAQREWLALAAAAPLSTTAAAATYAEALEQLLARLRHELVTALAQLSGGER